MKGKELSKRKLKKLEKLSSKMERVLTKIENEISNKEDRRFGRLVWNITQAWGGFDCYVYDHLEKDGANKIAP